MSSENCGASQRNPDMQKTILIIGLGNPGKKYEHSPHNAGFAVIDMLAKEIGEESRKEEKLATVWEGTLEDTSVILAKPKTFMNNSGVAVHSLAKSYKLKAPDLHRESTSDSKSQSFRAISSSVWLVHDDVDLPLGTLRIVKNRGSAGHKGVQSVIQELGTKNFVRIRVGIRPEGMRERRSKALMNRFVIGRYTPAQHDLFIQELARCREAARYALQNGVEKAMTLYNMTLYNR